MILFRQDQHGGQTSGFFAAPGALGLLNPAPQGVWAERHLQQQQQNSGAVGKERSTAFPVSLSALKRKEVYRASIFFFSSPSFQTLRKDIKLKFRIDF